MKKILFLSGIDFKEKSIQIIRKTPENYLERGWNVDYVVTRDMSSRSNYFYEKEINPSGINVIRIPLNFSKSLDAIQIPGTVGIKNKIKNLCASYILFKRARKLLNTNNYDVVYGYENIGVIACILLNFFGKLNKVKTISRFQGTWLNHFYKTNKLKFYWNFDAIIAMKFKSDMAIMTDDGTQGDIIFSQLNQNVKNVHFWTNGVDVPEVDEAKIEALKKQFEGKKHVVLSVSRLVNWKRVDRIIDIIERVVELSPQSRKDFVYVILGDGANKSNLEKLVEDKNLNDVIHFTGAVPNTEVKNYMAFADFFMSFYNLSNVGNPLLEAIRNNKIIFTLDNGDTPKWINHKKSGFIYDHTSSYTDQVAKDLIYCFNNEDVLQQMKQEVNTIADEKLMTWKQRFEKEVTAVENLIQKG